MYEDLKDKFNEIRKKDLRPKTIEEFMFISDKEHKTIILTTELLMDMCSRILVIENEWKQQDNTDNEKN